ncbi:universal stress protein [Mangrovicoccus algicola]|uniref:Universal stress protein n=1 Tax=Mangrovicoccus algicola TaxID=2771008 RepID=A0A8J7D0F1_9RHOB|nr:universal stress protein [Mangrovicoccus algicola]MBE3639358.1 universal stress protein [Mangrovicoccus algicola]
MSKMIALVDGSTYSQSVCDLAAWAAARTGAGITVAHVMGHRQGVKQDLSGNIGLGARTQLLDELAELDAAQARLAQKRGRAILEDAQARIAEAGIAEVEVRLRSGDLVEAMQELEAGADYLLIGKRGEAADYAKLHLGSNFERVARSATCPIIVAARAFKPVSKVMIAFDGKPAALKAVDHAMRDPIFAGLDFHVIMAGSESVEGRRRLDGALAMLRGAGHNAEGDILPGSPDEVIAREIGTRGADMLVMGAYGHSRIRGLLLGSTTSELVRACQVPVLLIR